MEGKTEEVERVEKKPHFRSGPEADSANYHAARKARFERCGSVVAFAALLSRRVPRIAESAILTMRERSRLHRHDGLQKRDMTLPRVARFVWASRARALVLCAL